MDVLYLACFDCDEGAIAMPYREPYRALLADILVKGALDVELFNRVCRMLDTLEVSYGASISGTPSKESGDIRFPSQELQNTGRVYAKGIG